MAIKKIEPQEYSNMTDKASPPSPCFKNCIWAFVVGGGICVLGQFIYNILIKYGLKTLEARSWVSIILITVTVILTALHIFGTIAKFAGAGTLVPITGFANSVVSPAIEFKAEGQILGLGTKIFTIAGPVILYGTAASVVVGFIYWVFTMLS